jgi:hypothetical protein
VGQIVPLYQMKPVNSALKAMPATSAQPLSSALFAVTFIICSGEKMYHAHHGQRVVATITQKRLPQLAATLRRSRERRQRHIR